MVNKGPYNQSWLFVGISHASKEIPIKIPVRNCLTPGYPESKKCRKIPESRGFFGFPRDFFEIFKSRSRSSGFSDFRDFAHRIFSGFFLAFHIPITISGISEFSGFLMQDFSGFFRNFHIQISNPGISGNFRPSLE